MNCFIQYSPLFLSWFITLAFNLTFWSVKRVQGRKYFLYRELFEKMEYRVIFQYFLTFYFTFTFPPLQQVYKSWTSRKHDTFLDWERFKEHYTLFSPYYPLLLTLSHIVFPQLLSSSNLTKCTGNERTIHELIPYWEHWKRYRVICHPFPLIRFQLLTFSLATSFIF